MDNNKKKVKERYCHLVDKGSTRVHLRLLLKLLMVLTILKYTSGFILISWKRRVNIKNWTYCCHRSSEYFNDRPTEHLALNIFFN